MALTQDQSEAYQLFQSNQVSFISGPAGTGKSFLIKHIQQECKYPVITLSSTGISAHHIEGMTVHSFLCRLRMKVVNPTSNTIFIIDEISMLGKKVFESFELQLRKFFSNGQYFDSMDISNLFGGVKIVLFGDFAQLPPIQDEFCFMSELWDQIQCYELKTVKRQKEVSFQSFLSRVRIGKILKEDRTLLLKLSKRKVETTTHLFLSNQEAEEFNRNGLESLDKECFHYDAKITHFNTNENDRQTFFRERHQCYERLSLCVGAKCMLTANLDVSSGWCNGTLGTISECDEKTIIMKNQKGVSISIPKKQYYRSKHRLPCDVISKKRPCGETNCSHPPMYYFMDEHEWNEEKLQKQDGLLVDQFPLLLSWGITIHKSQGMTLDSCTIVLPTRYSPSLIYVALSRCVSMDGIAISSATPIRMDQICPSPQVMETIFQWKSKECSICKDTYIGPYASFCQDCCSAPGKYANLRFIDFIADADPSPDMLSYIHYAITHPDQSTTTKWKKFVTFCKTI